ncbi:MAG: hypothetical protein Q9179_002704 [Wetmoreana sp. 5 TL-2023]
MFSDNCADYEGHDVLGAGVAASGIAYDTQSRISSLLDSPISPAYFTRTRLVTSDPSQASQQNNMERTNPHPLTLISFILFTTAIVSLILIGQQEMKRVEFKHHRQHTSHGRLHTIRFRRRHQRHRHRRHTSEHCHIWRGPDLSAWRGLSVALVSVKGSPEISTVNFTTGRKENILKPSATRHRGYCSDLDTARLKFPFHHQRNASPRAKYVERNLRNAFVAICVLSVGLNVIRYILPLPVGEYATIAEIVLLLSGIIIFGSGTLILLILLWMKRFFSAPDRNDMEKSNAIVVDDLTTTRATTAATSTRTAGADEESPPTPPLRSYMALPNLVLYRQTAHYRIHRRPHRRQPTLKGPQVWPPPTPPPAYADRGRPWATRPPTPPPTPPPAYEERFTLTRPITQ